MEKFITEKFNKENRDKYGTTTLIAMAAGVAVIVVGFAFCLSILNGWAISTLWGWFIVPQFMVAPLNIPTSIGIGALITYLVSNYNVKVDDEKLSLSIMRGILRPIVFVGMGWCVLQFM